MRAAVDRAVAEGAGKAAWSAARAEVADLESVVRELVEPGRRR